MVNWDELNEEWICRIDKKGNPITLYDNLAKLRYHTRQLVIQLWDNTLGKLGWLRPW